MWERPLPPTPVSTKPRFEPRPREEAVAWTCFEGESKGFWAVTVRANWRVIFRFAQRGVMDVDYVDYH